MSEGSSRDLERSDEAKKKKLSNRNRTNMKSTRAKKNLHSSSATPEPENNTTKPNARIENQTTKPNTRTKKKANSRPGQVKGKPIKKDSKPKDIKNDYRYLEIIKLLKNHNPITINGIPTTKIIEQTISQDAGVTDEKNPTNKQIINNHLYQTMTNNSTNDIYLSFKIIPSDPDFPYDIESLNFNLCIPYAYPYKATSKPSIIVLNDDIPRGFAINIEQGFKKIVAIAMDGEKFVLEKIKIGSEDDDEGEIEEIPITLVEGKGLLSQIKTLDKYLEEFLKQEKRQTIKFIRFKGNDKSQSPSPSINQQQQKQNEERKKQQELETEKQNQRQEQKKQTELNKLISSTNVSASILTKRNELIDELVHKFQETDVLKLFNKNNHGNKYKLTITLPHKPTIPYLWKLNNHKLDIFISIPINYPHSKLILSLPNNFSTNLVLKHKNTIEEGKVNQTIATLNQSDLIETINETKKFEKNMVENFSNTNFEDDNLVHIINWIANNVEWLGKFEAKQYEDFKLNLSKLNKGL